MSSFYAVMKTDRRRRADERVDRRVNRQAAERVVRELNAKALADYGPTGPLYYVERVDAANNHKR